MKSKHLRLIIQIVFFLLIGLITVNHTLEESGASLAFIPSVSLHAICPFGAIETLGTFITGGELVRQLHASVMVIGAVVLLLTVIFGPVFCSHICPLGSIQEWLGKLGKRIFKNRYNKLVPQKLHNILKYLRYVVLVLIVWQTYQSGFSGFSGRRPVLRTVSFLDRRSHNRRDCRVGRHPVALTRGRTALV